MIAILDAANDLKLLPRTGWLLAGVPRAESVADHSFAVAILALALAETINLDPQAHGMDAPLDCSLLMRIALIHDLAESRVTDLPHRATELLGVTVKHEAEQRAMEGILDGLPFSAGWLARFDDYTQSVSAEALLVRDADKLEMTHQAAQYARSGLTTLSDFLRMRTYSFALCTRLHEQILAAYLPRRVA